MKCSRVTSEQLDSVWPVCAALLAKGFVYTNDEMDISQLRLQVVQGTAELIMAKNDSNRIVLAVAISYHNMPNYRIAHIISIGGEGATMSTAEWQQLKEYCKSRGATKIQGYCQEAQARLWIRLGFQETYTRGAMLRPAAG